MNNSKITYKAYARKSSEREDRQALSIESQIDEAKRIGKLNGIEVTDEMILQESKSAKKPYTRPQFEALVVLLEKGDAQGIIAWHPNRLSRNSIDAARLIDLMDRGLLKEIVTQQQVFRNTPNDKFMLMLFCSQAKMENDNKGIDVKRGLLKKYRMGFPPGIAKVGYVNDYGKKGMRRILIDNERFGLMKQTLEAFLSGKYSVRKLLVYANDKLGLRTIQRQKEGGKPIKLSRIYDMLKDPFYAGFFYGDDENGIKTRFEVDVSVPRMISESQFWQIQTMLGRKGVTRPKVHDKTFPYRGWGNCACGCVMTADEKHQLICSNCKYKFAYKNRTHCPKCNIAINKMENPTYLHYKYYFCTKKKGFNCKGSVTEQEIDEYVATYFQENLQMSPELSKWCIDNLDHLEQQGKKNDYEIKGGWIKEKEQKEKQFKNLVRMKTLEQLTDEEYSQQRDLLKSEIEQIDKALGDTTFGDQNCLDEAKKLFNMAVDIAETIKNGDFEEKQEVLSTMGSNLKLKEKKLSITNKKLVSVIVGGLLEAKQLNPEFEPEKCEANKDKTDVFTSVCPTLLRRQDSNL